MARAPAAWGRPTPDHPTVQPSGLARAPHFCNPPHFVKIMSRPAAFGLRLGLRVLTAFMACVVFFQAATARSALGLERRCAPNDPRCRRRRWRARTTCHVARQFASQLPPMASAPTCPPEADLCILPQPAQLTRREGHFELSSRTRIFADPQVPCRPLTLTGLHEWGT